MAVDSYLWQNMGDHDINGYVASGSYSWLLVDIWIDMWLLAVIVSPDESRGYLGLSMVTPPQRFPFGRDNLKNILVRTFKFGMWVYMGNATNAFVL